MPKVKRAAAVALTAAKTTHNSNGFTITEGNLWLPSRGRLSNGFHQEVRVHADSQSNARAILEAQFGKGSILSGPWSVHTQ